MEEKNISGAVAEIHGRYPEKGFAVNETCKELVFIINGTGNIVTEKDNKSFVLGDTIFVDRGEKFYWQGDFTMFMATTPKFSPDQHKVVK